MKRVAARSRKAQGKQTRGAVLERAVHLASTEGLEGLTIGRLATELLLSKSGLFAHFGSKEELQIATVKTARSIFIRNVIQPAMEESPGLPRLLKLCDLWLGHVQSRVFRGGCFFAAVAAEFDSRPGAVRDCIAEIMMEWLVTLRRAIVEAQEVGHLDSEVDVEQLVFEFNSLELGANWSMQLHGSGQAFTRAREAMVARLHQCATSNGKSLLPLKAKPSLKAKRIVKRRRPSTK